MKITSIEVQNIKGIKAQIYPVDFIPYKPHLLVAPNGFGKSSLAVAFASMNSKRMILDKNHYHQGDENNRPKLAITVENNGINETLVADADSNAIHNKLELMVINSRLKPEATKRNMGVFTAATASLEINPIVLCKLQEKAGFNYHYSAQKQAFGANGKALPNLTALLVDASILKALNAVNFSKVTGTRIQTSINNAIIKINGQGGNAESIKDWINTNLLGELQVIQHLPELASALRGIQVEAISSDADAYLAAIQLINLYRADADVFKKTMRWLEYVRTKAHFEKLLSDFKSSEWEWASLKEDKKKKELRIEFPQAHQISNGQRDVLSLILQLENTLVGDSTRPLILVVDEVFDYLDDANLVAFQYYITKLIGEFKSSGREIFPLILTHLDPGLFYHFCFNSHKIKVHYLSKQTCEKSRNAIRLIEMRETSNNEEFKNGVEKHYFHHHTATKMFADADWPSGLPAEWKDSTVFSTYIYDELNRYLSDQNHDVVAVCFGLRLKIEEKAFCMLTDAARQNSFLEKHTTKKKLEYCVELGMDVPDTYFLLGVIHNDNLHWKQDKDFISPLIAKLQHPTIKQLIRSATA